jgi:Fe-S cluster assembly protein SufD
MNAALGEEGLLVYVPHDASIDRPITVSSGAAAGTSVFPRVVIVADEGASVTVVERFGSAELGAEALCVSVVEIYAEQGAHVNYLAVQDWPQTVWHFHIQRAIVGRDATVRSLTAALGARLSRSVVQSVLDGQGAHAEMLGVYFGDHDQHIDNRTLQLHRAPHTTSELYYKGALKGHARAIYSGLVDIEKEGTMADARQANRNLLLSEHASADPSPFLEIKTCEVVRATHGVSVGRPDEQVLFYLRSRGLGPAEAERVFVKGFFQEIIDRVRAEPVRSELEAAVEAELELED